jgi:hypothetical protein
MKRILALAVLALALPATAAAKGPSEATMSGPGLGSPLVFRGGGEGDTETPLGALVGEAGFFPAVFGQSPDPMLAHKPSTPLGPRYRLEYRMPGANGKVSTIRQDFYPYAKGGPASYMKPGQPFWEGGQKTRGGWYQGPGYLQSQLVKAGLPPTAPTGGGGGGSALPGYAIVLLIAFGVLVAGAAAAAVVVRRRPGTAPAA